MQWLGDRRQLGNSLSSWKQNCLRFNLTMNNTHHYCDKCPLTFVPMELVNNKTSFCRHQSVFMVRIAYNPVGQNIIELEYTRASDSLVIFYRIMVEPTSPLQFSGGPFVHILFIIGHKRAPKEHTCFIITYDITLADMTKKGSVWMYFLVPHKFLSKMNI